MDKHSKMVRKTDEDEEIIRLGNESEASVKEDLADLEEEQSENKKNKDKRTRNDSEKSSESRRAHTRADENEDEDEGLN